MAEIETSSATARLEILNGGFEGSSSPWVKNNFPWTNTGAYPQAGTGYVDNTTTANSRRSAVR